MTTPGALGLARVTIAASGRRVDVTLPEHVPVAELLPSLARHAGADLADAGEAHGGWVLRRSTGEEVAGGLSLAAQRVQDGEVLHLVPWRAEWPEPDYDDLVEAIARGVRRHGAAWSRAATRHNALAVTCLVLTAGLADVIRSLSEPGQPGLAALVVAAVLALAAVVLSRVVSDAVAGAVVAACALPYAFVGALVMPARAAAGPHGLAAPHLLLGSVTLVLFGLVGYVGVGALARIFVAAIYVGVLGMLAAALGYASSLSADDIAAVTVTASVGSTPALPLLAARLGRLPFPVLPQRPEELLQDRPGPPWADVFAAAARTGEVLTGLLWGTAAWSAVTVGILVSTRQAAAWALACVVTAAVLVRARLYPTSRQRVPILAGGVLAAMIVLGFSLVRLPPDLLPVHLAALVVAAGAVLAAGLVSSVRPPTPFAGRVTDIADALLVAAFVPLVCAVVGVYGYVQGLLAAVGG
jgi:type VII secretion integral membrane protein EccD